MGLKNIETKTRNKMNRDRLLGAPGHTAGELLERNENTEESEAKTSFSVVSSKKAKEGATSNVDKALAKLSEMFGEENVETIRNLLTSNAKDAEEKIMSMVKQITANLPQNFELPKLSAVKNHPVASATTLAAGVGSLFLLREYIKRGTVMGMEPSELIGTSTEKSSTKTARSSHGGTSKAKTQQKKASGAKVTSAKKASGKNSSAKKVSARGMKKTQTAKTRISSKAKKGTSKKSA